MSITVTQEDAEQLRQSLRHVVLDLKVNLLQQWSEADENSVGYLDAASVLRQVLQYEQVN